MKYEQIQKANDAIKTTPIKGKDYAEVNQRIKAFRMVYPDGYIETEMIGNENGVCVFKAECGYTYKGADKDGYPFIKRVTLGVGHAYEKEGSTFINKTSYIENCETSAVGRALGMAGFGIDTSVASADELQNAIANQGDKSKKVDREPVIIPTEENKNDPASVKQVEQIEALCKADKVPAQFIVSSYDSEDKAVKSLDDLTVVQAYSVVKSWEKVKASYEKTLEGIPFN